MLKWEENGHKCELRMQLNDGVWEKGGREVIARDIVAALRANPEVLREVQNGLMHADVPKALSLLGEVRGMFHGQSVTCVLRQDCDNPSGPMSLGDRLAVVTCWPAKELPLWRVELAAPDCIETASGDGRLLLAGQANDFQMALTSLEDKIESVRAWVEGALRRG